MTNMNMLKHLQCKNKHKDRRICSNSSEAKRFKWTLICLAGTNVSNFLPRLPPSKKNSRHPMSPLPIATCFLILPHSSSFLLQTQSTCPYVLYICIIYVYIYIFFSLEMSHCQSVRWYDIIPFASSMLSWKRKVCINLNLKETIMS